MADNTEKLRTEMERNAELYAPIIEWCEQPKVPLVTDASEFDHTTEFYRALDKIVRREDFSLATFTQILAANWPGDTTDPECAGYYDEICWRAMAVRQYLEARGEVKKRESKSERTGPHLH